MEGMLCGQNMGVCQYVIFMDFYASFITNDGQVCPKTKLRGIIMP